MVLVDTLRLNCMSNQTHARRRRVHLRLPPCFLHQRRRPSICSAVSEIMGPHRGRAVVSPVCRKRRQMPKNFAREGGTCAPCRSVPARAIACCVCDPSSEHQHAPHDIDARALVVGPAATVRRCRGHRGRPRRPSRRPRHAAARSQGHAAARRPMGSAALRRVCFARASGGS
jgi:hypothetical protein